MYDNAQPTIRRAHGVQSRSARNAVQIALAMVTLLCSWLANPASAVRTQATDAGKPIHILRARPVETPEDIRANVNIKNPLIAQRADPWCLRHADGKYYFTATAPEYDRIELRVADSIGALTAAKPNIIWRKHEKGPMSYHIWAPEIHHIDGKWYVHFAAGRAEDIWAIRMYVLECSDADPRNP